MGIYHIFDPIGYKVSRRERIEHTVMPHCNTIVDGYRIEFSGEATQLFDFGLYFLPDFVQMHMSGYKLCKRIDYSDNRFSQLFFFHSVGSPKSSCSCHPAALRAGCTA